MNRQELIKIFSDNHHAVIAYIQALPDSLFLYRNHEK